MCVGKIIIWHGKCKSQNLMRNTKRLWTVSKVCCFTGVCCLWSMPSCRTSIAFLRFAVFYDFITLLLALSMMNNCSIWGAFWFADHGYSFPSFLFSFCWPFICLLLQGLSLLLAMILKALGPHQYYDSDDEYVTERVPLLKNAVLPPPYVIGDPVYGSKNDAWNIRINDKVAMFDSFNGSCAIFRAYISH